MTEPERGTADETEAAHDEYEGDQHEHEDATAEHEHEHDGHDHDGHDHDGHAHGDRAHPGSDAGVVETDLPTAARWVAQQLDAAERVLIGAGAGLSVAAGIDYSDEASFAQLFPAMHRRGFRARYQLIGYPGLTPAQHWGYWSTHVNDVRFGERRHPAYATLLDEVGDTDYFVLTSNVDGMFPRNGFDPERIWTPQGDYALMQCLQPCRPVVWPSEPLIKRALAATDPVSQEVMDPDAIPRCPNCGGPVFLNVNAGRWFLNEHYRPQFDRLRAWLNAKPQTPLLILEIGAGMNTPSVIRWPLERLAMDYPRATFIRVNPEYPGVPAELGERGAGLRFGALELIAAVADVRRSTREVERSA
jgi:NAD-dependent SIR2 family protein deacetylase